MLHSLPMKRRDLLPALALLGLDLPADEPTHLPESVYIPKAHLVEDKQYLQRFMHEFAFADLITATPTLRITHIPTLYDPEKGTYGTVFGHISRQNAQLKAFDGATRGTVVFHGPHAYISPTWYSQAEVVPTWNFGVVHATGKLTPVEDKKQLHALLARLIQRFEGTGTSYDFLQLPDNFVTPMLGGIIGFAMEVELLEGKFKLGQERSPADRESVVRHLAAAKPEMSVAAFTADFYKFRGK